MKAKGISRFLYKFSRKTYKISAFLNDVDVISSGDSKRIFKRFKRKFINKAIYGSANKINRKVNK